MRVNFYATLRADVGRKTVEVDLPPGASVRELAHVIAARWPVLADRVLGEGGALTRRVHFMVDGRNARWLPDGGDTRLDGREVVDVFPPTAGG